MTLVVDTLNLYGGVSYVSTLFEAQELAAGASAVSDVINIAQETYSIHVSADFGASGALTITALVENSDPESEGLTPVGYENICTDITSEGVYLFSLPPGAYRRLKITNTGDNSVTTTVVLAAQGRDRGEKGDPGAAAPSVMFRPYDGYIQWYDFDAGAWRNLTSENWGTENLSIVAGSIANVNTTGANIADIATVAGIDSEVTTVAGVATNVTTVAGIDSDVATVAGIASNVSTVAGVAANVTTVAGVAANVTTVAGIDSEVATVAGAAANVATVATDLTGDDDIGTVADWLNAGGSLASGVIYDNSSSGLTADDVQGAIDEVVGEKQNIITGAGSSVTTSNLSSSKVLVSDASGKIAASPTISTTELEYLDNVTSSIQTQLNGKASLSGAAFTGPVTVQDATEAHQPLALGQFPSSLGTSGWKKYPDANSPTGYVIEQWVIGPANTVENMSIAVTFPMTFPNAVLYVSVSTKSTGADRMYQLKSYTTSGCIVAANTMNTASGTDYAIIVTKGY